ncbi:MAG: Cro/Cl family transcriptional regulator [Geobacteraceae bacterium GWC2_58_44]|nr:MAG: Cro/Cl family transcriptional regulator [Geobacteraceae bacterium GWC2_58_44]HBG05557.1 Cro/Cl family transcriptional regulator [Geobacter sp.]
MTSMEYQLETGTRIRKARLALGLTQKEFAASLGIVQGFLSGIETGRKRPSDTLLIALSHTHRINPGWLKHGTGETFTGPAEAASQTGARAPLLDVIPAQFPEVGGEIRGYVSVPNLPDGCYAIVCYGDFMAPTIRDGDLVIFKPGRDKKSGDIILVNNRWGEPILRRYRVKDDEVFLAPDNPVYAPFRPDSGTRTIGTVVEVWRKMLI